MQSGFMESYEHVVVNNCKLCIRLAIFVLIILLNCSKMTDLGKRILECRKRKNLSQTDLANLAGISYAQIGRYETKGTQPPAEVLRKIADALDTTVDYLINGATDEKAKTTLKDSELLQQFKAIEQMSEDDKQVVKKLIDAFITKGRLKQLAL